MGQKKFRITAQTLEVLGSLVSSTEEVSGADIARETGLTSGTLYPILIRLEESRWIESRWESADPRELGRPRRRLYRITTFGARKSRAEFKKVEAAIRRPAWGLS